MKGVDKNREENSMSFCLPRVIGIEFCAKSAIIMYMVSKRRKLIGFGVVVIAILATGFYLLATSTQRKLGGLGYSAAEIDVITARLEREELQPIFETEYLPELVQMLEEREAPADFRVEKLADYVQAQQKYGFAPDLTVRLVNHPDYDAETEYTELKVDILYSEYYLPRNRERYFNLVETEPNSDTKAIVARVNANRDRDYYTETEAAKLENGNLLLVNKYYYLDHDFEVELVEQDASYGSPGERMETETYAAFEKMFQAALAEGYQLYVTSGYRGYEEQEEVFAGYVAEGGEEHALQYAAKPGHSEHQTGRAIDVFTPGETTRSFAASPVAGWLAEHAYEYGFVLRYPEGKEDLTGYSYEPWHYRYAGCEAAAEIQRRGLTLEEYVAVFGN